MQSNEHVSGDGLHRHLKFVADVYADTTSVASTHVVVGMDIGSSSTHTAVLLATTPAHTVRELQAADDYTLKNNGEASVLSTDGVLVISDHDGYTDPCTAVGVYLRDDDDTQTPNRKGDKHWDLVNTEDGMPVVHVLIGNPVHHPRPSPSIVTGIWMKLMGHSGGVTGATISALQHSMADFLTLQIPPSSAAAATTAGVVESDNDTDSTQVLRGDQCDVVGNNHHQQHRLQHQPQMHPVRILLKAFSSIKPVPPLGAYNVSVAVSPQTLTSLVAQRQLEMVDFVLNHHNITPSPSNHDGSGDDGGRRRPLSVVLAVPPLTWSTTSRTSQRAAWRDAIAHTGSVDDDTGVGVQVRVVTVIASDVLAALSVAVCTRNDECDGGNHDCLVSSRPTPAGSASPFYLSMASRCCRDGSRGDDDDNSDDRASSVSPPRRQKQRVVMVVDVGTYATTVSVIQLCVKNISIDGGCDGDDVSGETGGVDAADRVCITAKVLARDTDGGDVSVGVDDERSVGCVGGGGGHVMLDLLDAALLSRLAQAMPEFTHDARVGLRRAAWKLRSASRRLMFQHEPLDVANRKPHRIEVEYSGQSGACNYEYAVVEMLPVEFDHVLSSSFDSITSVMSSALESYLAMSNNRATPCLPHRAVSIGDVALVGKPARLLSLQHAVRAWTEKHGGERGMRFHVADAPEQTVVRLAARVGGWPEGTLEIVEP